ncbi:hypothetical protein SAMN05216489_07583 [Streptomyces sp. 3213]|uniref:hypothetical protein n=1 Tax=Streptomyces sp. 3213.3 TaxID=1855348 RepID=UPI0008954183|nr:hypothetical protein [Streptomyces sp. 3213.3]SEE64819.1 hypothetical protein SAMN05216489_07583 [Streptomyces sp. 3213] [Streptomyces sp. 3213.3]
MKKRGIAALVAGLAAVALGLTPGTANASDNQPLSASTTGASVSLTVDWTGSESFTLRNVKLSDTSCDAHPVFFYVTVPGFQFPNHWNTSGCGTTTTWSALPGSLDGGIHSLGVTVCRDTTFDNCSTSGASLNPYD